MTGARRAIAAGFLFSVYRHFIDHGSAPTLDALAQKLEQPAEQIQQSLINLEEHRAFAEMEAGFEQLGFSEPFWRLR